jgi:GR25 family glycosyltransferase involved in LPS biosynthesis
MKAYVITITSLSESIEIANRCINSGKQFGIDIEIFPAITPKDYIFDLVKRYNININGFDERFSRKENAIACFLSHYSLWKLCADTNENLFILEHDAVIVNTIDMNMNFKGVLSLGKPSYGKFNIPRNGIGPLVSKDYLPGAHAYMIKPKAATDLINRSKLKAIPTDVFIDRRNFPWIEEFYPWPVEVHDSFSTVQKLTGCIAKHNYKEGFKLL